MPASTHTFHLAPRDLLFLRDARPMEAADAGLGANWPRPDQLWNALINSFHRQWPEPQPWEHAHHKRDGENPFSSDRFGALKTAGPWPLRLRQKGTAEAADLFLPCPLDLSADDEGMLHPMRLVASTGSDLPGPLTHAFASTKIGKHEAPAWVSAAEFVNYLQGKAFKPATADLYDTERNIGIAIDTATHSTVEGKFYQAEYLRLHDDVRLAVQATCNIIGDNRQPVDVFDQLGQGGVDLIMGGQQGVVRALRTPQPPGLPCSHLAGDGLLLKWVLLSPAVFPAIATNPEKGIRAHPGGWLPNWINPGSGQVMLPRESVERQPDENRDAWRQRAKQAPRFAARLIAARIGKPLAFSGWDLQTGPKPTLLAVPAGSVYVFQCDEHAEVGALAKALSWNGASGCEPRNRRSTLLGEKGFGLGVCATWNPLTP